MLQVDFTCIHFLSWQKERVSHFWPIIERVVNFVKKIASNALWTFSQAETKSPTCSCFLEEHVVEEVSELVKVFAELTSNSCSFDCRSAITWVVAIIVCALCFCKRYDHSDEEFLRIVKMNDDLLKASSTANPADFIPCFCYLPLWITNAPPEIYQALNPFLVLTCTRSSYNIW